MNHNLTILFFAYILEATVGYPKFVYKRIKHPVVWMGAVISFLDKVFNMQHVIPALLPTKVGIQNLKKDWIPAFAGMTQGAFCMIILLSITLAISLFIQSFNLLWLEIICAAILLATRSLYDHVNDVYKSLRFGDIETARRNLAKIVGRDVENMEEAEISKAAIESLAESFSDGVVAPLFWGACFGLAGIACYKAINTADSMIGHKTERYKYFGWAAARLDDVANFIPARLSALLIIISSGKIPIINLAREAKKHASPNSGYPEAAMAGVLGICLGGDRSYDGEKHTAPFIGEGLRREINIDDLQKALRLYVRVCMILFVVQLLYWIILNPPSF